MIKQNPFSLYDFLGYFIPGALVIYLILFINDNVGVENAALALNQNKNFQVENFLFFIILSYSLGHLINFLSSITVERYANWKYNYPSKYLMNFNQNYKFWDGNKKVIIWKTILVIVILPISLFDLIFGELFSFKIFYTKKADDYIIDIVKHKGPLLLTQLNAPATQNLRSYDFHRIFSHYVYETSKNHQSKLTNYVTLYGFLRSLCLISTFFVWMIIIEIIKSVYSYYSFYTFFQNTKTNLSYLLLISIISYVFFMAFMKFYRRYSLESLMLIVIDKEIR